MRLDILASILSAASLVVAHGAVTSYEIGGTTYPGYTGYSPSTSPPTIERQWPDYNPILSVSDPMMTCNGGTSAALNATVAPGENVTAIWAQWTHQQGPVMVWMYDCGSDFSSCDGKSQKWFKIDQMGMTAPPLTGTSWGTAIVAATLKWTSTIPTNLAPGNYLIRHELLAIHQANTPQFYPECAQLVVTGSGTAAAPSSFLYSIPAYASATDPGIDIDIYTSTATTYTIPAGDVYSGFEF
ncbi:family 61 glycoside hydrolase [Cryphonectria parasitica EP155]|uniref:lytic cellulose monooxygenase (C4-dehydrogenating) n=1 Tax=Cryphonectria parasitica (strain ATCC 38755 / EP155) TaxID=660469 RepID=A0A9P4Y7Z5_CRYP1|nr:family 61 glycoside hydrolase [Cryphonectria parasitica EP155]KAF3768607.1 family 61 glycoside hydrolase [Cryphonectria parasitica EP155]